MPKRQLHPVVRHAAKAVKVVKSLSGRKQPRRPTFGRIVEAILDALAR